MSSTTDLDGFNSALEPTRDRKNGVAPLCFDRRGHERDVGSKHPHHISRTYTRWCRFFWSRHGRRHLPSSRQFPDRDRKSTRLNSSHDQISYAVFCLKKKNTSS